MDVDEEHPSPFENGNHGSGADAQDSRDDSTPYPSSPVPQTESKEDRKSPRSKVNYVARYILSGHTMGVSSLKFSPDGALLASAGACSRVDALCERAVTCGVDESKLPTS